MVVFLQDVVLVLLISILTGVSYEKVQDESRRKPSQFYEARVEDAQAEPEPQSDARRSENLGAVLSPRSCSGARLR